MDSSGIFCFFFDFPHDFPSDHIFLSWQFPFLPPAARLQGTKIQRAKPLPEDTEGGDWSMMLKYRQRAQPSDGQQSGKKVEVGWPFLFFGILQVLKLLLLTNYHELQLVHLINYHEVSWSIIKYHQVSSFLRIPIKSN